MAGIAGINKPGEFDIVGRMLDKISHRGKYGRKIFSTGNSTLGLVYNESESGFLNNCEAEKTVLDKTDESRFAIAVEIDSTLELARDEIGVAPLYYGYIYDRVLVFASEVKSLFELTPFLNELPPDSRLFKNKIRFNHRKEKITIEDGSDRNYAGQLFQRLDSVIKYSVNEKKIGSWLSGGLDSSALAVLVKPYVAGLSTFSSGVKDAPDLKYAAEMAEYLKSDHHEIIVSLENMIKVLDKVIYHLESFDPLLVRSSITNYLTAAKASDYVDEILSGEGGDELFGGYLYLKEIPRVRLTEELTDLTGRLHNTALQRVDRSASAFGLIAHTPFLNPFIIDLAFQIPPELKIKDGVEKWILRKAMEGKLPGNILNRTKAKFWEGAGVGLLLSDYADYKISDSDFRLLRQLKNGWTLNSKEELFYYLIFREYFGDLPNLDWMGRTKNSPTV